MDSALIIPILNSALIVVGGLLYIFRENKNNNSKTSAETIDLLKEQNQALRDKTAQKDIQLAEQKAKHETEIAEFKSRISALEAQFDHLKEANKVLQNTVTGKETLDMIVTIMKPIPALFLPGGFIENVKVNQEKTLKDLSEIKEAMHRSVALPSPNNRRFKKRNQGIEAVEEKLKD